MAKTMIPAMISTGIMDLPELRPSRGHRFVAQAPWSVREASIAVDLETAHKRHT